VEPPFSTNLAALQAVIAKLDIEDDPYVKSLRAALEKEARKSNGNANTGVGSAAGVGSSGGAGYSKEYFRIDQRLSKVLNKKDSFTQKGLRDLERSAYVCRFFVFSGDWL